MNKCKNIIKLLEKSKKSILKSRSLFPILLFSTTFIQYLYYICPSVYGGDSGDLLSAALTNGVAHPSGYPLYTMLAILFLKLPINTTPAWKVGLSSSILSSLTLILFYLIVERIIKHKPIALISSFIVAFSYPFWINALVVEVFALHNFFILLIIYLTLVFTEKPTNNKLFTLSFAIGLSLTNNLTIILLFPPLLLFFFLNKKFFSFLTIHRVVISLFFFLLGLAPYIYIPIAASQNPYINWGRAVNLNNFLHLVLRKDYGWGAGIVEDFQYYESLKLYMYYWKHFLSILLPFFAIFGFIHGFFTKNRKILLFFFFSSLFFGPLYTIYSRNTGASYSVIAAIERFFLSSIILLIVLVPIGMKSFIDYVEEIVKKRNITKLLTALSIITFTLIPISSYVANRDKTDLSNIYTYDNLAKDVLNPLPQNSYLIFFSDTYIFPTYYYQIAYDYRKDIILSGENSGFKNFLYDTDLLENTQVENYLKQNQNSISDKLLKKGVAVLVDRGSNVFTENNVLIEDEKIGKITGVPYGLVYKLVKEENMPNIETFINYYFPVFTNLNLRQFILNKNKFIVSENFQLNKVQLRYAKVFMDASYLTGKAYKDNNIHSFFDKISQAIYPEIVLQKEYQ